MTIKRHLILKFDGASRGNPGPAAIGAVLIDEAGHTVKKLARQIGEATNNQAEYGALIAGLQAAAELGATAVDARSDSELVVKQLQGKYKVRHPNMKPLFDQAQKLISGFERFSIKWVPREQNREAHEVMHSD
ncbi:MAG: ribonuclease HI family protein [Chloroflexi bacterium]|nr:ribonuclease HI family protein [Chloroflexota bacterium]